MSHHCHQIQDGYHVSFLACVLISTIKLTLPLSQATHFRKKTGTIFEYKICEETLSKFKIQNCLFNNSAIIFGVCRARDNNFIHHHLVVSDLSHLCVICTGFGTNLPKCGQLMMQLFMPILQTLCGLYLKTKTNTYIIHHLLISIYVVTHVFKYAAVEGQFCFVSFSAFVFYCGIIFLCIYLPACFVYFSFACSSFKWSFAEPYPQHPH